MSEIDNIITKTTDYFKHESQPSYIRLLDTPRVWGQAFGKPIMPNAVARQKQFARAIEEVIQTTDYRCDIASLNTPDPDWARIILGAIDTAMSAVRTRAAGKVPQIRFIFGQTPLNAAWEPANYTDFKGALIRLFRQRASDWQVIPEIWCGRFYRLNEGIQAGVLNQFSSGGLKPSDEIDITKMTWNHCKIIASDGVQALAGGHNLNMDLFTSYAPVHDVSVAVHGDAAQGAQDFLTNMWQCKSDLLTKEYLDSSDLTDLTWKGQKDDDATTRKPLDPLADSAIKKAIATKVTDITTVHSKGQKIPSSSDSSSSSSSLSGADKIKADDLKALDELKLAVFPVRQLHQTYDCLDEYKLATRVLSIGKYWKGSSMKTDYQKASEIMKEHLIKNAKHSIWMSQMDLISAWKKRWSDHVVCHWLMEALLANPKLVVKVVVSPLDAGAGAEGDQYSFGSGACRTYALIDYYMKHEVDTDKAITDTDGKRAAALKRLHIAPLYYTDKVDASMTTEGTT